MKAASRTSPGSHLEDVVNVEIPRFRNDGNTLGAGRDERLELGILFTRLVLAAGAAGKV